ncbi:LON peptidase N-terminal domain and RING finger protein 1 [Porphyridium purpureum]|uniref:LON peptidase N-terminal domain and RING finger protein 1 n=1 Tax=Porphyridium purpureum TaxID=35688 RepID=A0A5J4Z6D4_PORPP|nr:LON peptidase N-terminal domain and RING finger protein 1 [Porphyridium purpureum]|eukprot:POR1293..scf295_1
MQQSKRLQAWNDVLRTRLSVEKRVAALQVFLELCAERFGRGAAAPLAIRGCEDEGCLDDATWLCPVCSVVPLHPTTTVKGRTLCEQCYKAVRGEPYYADFFVPGVDATDPVPDIKLKWLVPRLLDRTRCSSVGISETVELSSEKLRGLSPDAAAKECVQLAARLLKQGRVAESIQKIVLMLQIPRRTSRYMTICALDTLSEALRVSEEKAVFLAAVGVHETYGDVAASIFPEGEAHLDALPSNIATEKVTQDVREEFECLLCSCLVYKPTTLPSGHSLCQQCVIRCLEVTDPSTGMAAPPICPMTRMPLQAYVAWFHSNDWLSGEPQLANRMLAWLCEQCLPEEFAKRQEDVAREAAEMSQSTANRFFPIFVLSVSFPGLPCNLHIFEPRYRLMMRRAIAGDRKFGICTHGDVSMLAGNRADADMPFASIGTMMHITSQSVLPDGRSFIETVGYKRFRVLERGMLDGYHQARIEYMDDPSPTDEDRQVAFRLNETFQHFVNPQTMSLVEDSLGRYPDPSREPFLLAYWIASVFFSRNPVEQYRALTQSPPTYLHRLNDLLTRFDAINLNGTVHVDVDGGSDPDDDEDEDQDEDQDDGMEEDASDNNPD